MQKPFIKSQLISEYVEPNLSNKGTENEVFNNENTNRPVDESGSNLNRESGDGNIVQRKKNTPNQEKKTINDSLKTDSSIRPIPIFSLDDLEKKVIQGGKLTIGELLATCNKVAGKKCTTLLDIQQAIHRSGNYPNVLNSVWNSSLIIQKYLDGLEFLNKKDG